MRAAMIAACALFLSTAACAQDRASQAQAALLAWLECIECRDGELDALVRFGSLIEDPLLDILQRGPVPARLAEFKYDLRQSYRQAPAHPAGMTEDRYVAMFLENFVAREQIRAILALERLRTQRAIAGLQRAAANTQLRRDVREAAQRALAPPP